MKKLFLLTVLTLLTTHVLAAPRETPTDTANDSICLRKGLNLKMKMKEVDDLIAKSTIETSSNTEKKTIDQ